MNRRPETENGWVPFFGLGDWRDWNKLNIMSISELVSELRDTFLRSDFDLVEMALVAREERLKKEIEEMKKEIGKLQKEIQFERLEKINVELELERVKREGSKEEFVKVGEIGNGFDLDGKNVNAEVGCERCKLEDLKNKGVADGDASAVVELEDEKVEFLTETKKRWVGESGAGTGKSPSLPSKKDDIRASAGGRLGMRNIINIEDSDEEECNSQAALNRKETTSCNITDNKHLSSSREVQKNLPTRLAEPIGILKREFASPREFGRNINILDGLDSDSSSSSSSSSSGSLDLDSLPLSSLTSNKKMRTDATNLGLNSQLR